jgi:hypothetical protein
MHRGAVRRAKDFTNPSGWQLSGGDINAAVIALR